MRLYEINHELAALWAEVNEADEITPEMSERFNELKMARDEKLKYLGCLLLNERAEVEAVKGEVERMTQRRKRLEAKIDSLEGFLLAQLGDEKFSCPQFILSVRSGPPAVELRDGMEIPSQYVKTKVVESVDKELIKTDLKGGATLPFAHLVTNKFLSIR
jgi:hypothetical protein